MKMSSPVMPANEPLVAVSAPSTPVRLMPCVALLVTVRSARVALSVPVVRSSALPVPLSETVFVMFSVPKPEPLMSMFESPRVTPLIAFTFEPALESATIVPPVLVSSGAVPAAFKRETADRQRLALAVQRLVPLQHDPAGVGRAGAVIDIDDVARRHRHRRCRSRR